MNDKVIKKFLQEEIEDSNRYLEVLKSLIFRLKIETFESQEHYLIFLCELYNIVEEECNKAKQDLAKIEIGGEE